MQVCLQIASLEAGGARGPVKYTTRFARAYPARFSRQGGCFASFVYYRSFARSWWHTEGGLLRYQRWKLARIVSCLYPAKGRVVH